MTHSRKITWISLVAIVVLALALLFTSAVVSVANAEPEGHTHDGVTFTAWSSTTSLPGSAGSYYLTADVTISGAWTLPSGTTNLCLNGHGIRTTSGRVITINGGTLNLYDCGDTTHYFDVDENGKAVNVNATSGEKSFTGGYLTGGGGAGGLGHTSYYFSDGGAVLVWSGTFNMYGGTILGNSANKGGGVEVVNATMNLYGGAITYNTCGQGGAGINLRSYGPSINEATQNVTLNMYGGTVSYNKGTGIDQCYCYGNRYLNLHGGTISNNTANGIWVANTAVDGSPVIEGNGGYGMLANGLTMKGSPVFDGNGNADIYVVNNQNITLTGALDSDPIGVLMQNKTGVFTSGWSDYMTDDPADYFYSFNADYHVESEEGEAKLVEGPSIHVNNLQGTIKTFVVNKTDTIGSVKQTAATAFGVTASDYKLTLGSTDLTDTATVESSGIKGNDTLYLLPVSGGLKTLTLVPSVTSTATETVSGVYEAINEGDTVTITYASTQNSGFSEAIFTTAFDEEYFHLTSFAVDTAHYTLLDNYGREVGDTYVPMTLAQHIADHNAALDAGEEPYTGRLTFAVTFTDALFDTEGVLSDQFITVTYTAVKDIPSGVEFAFGFDMDLDGMFTHAAYDDEILLNIIDENGDTVDEEMVTLIVKYSTQVTIPADQVLVFDRDGDDYFVNTDDIELTWNAPTFGAQEANPYIADGGSVTYTFYTKVGDEYVRVENGNGEPIVPNAVGDYFVKATLPETESYLGYETGYVAISVARRAVEVPALKLYADEDSETAVYDDHKKVIAMDSVTYGSTLSLKEIVENDEEVAYALPATNGASIDDLTYSFGKKNGDEWDAIANFFSNQPLSVGTYKLTILPRDTDYVEFDADPSVEAIVIEITIVKAKVVAPTETEDTFTYNGEEQTYTFASAGSSALYTVTNNKRTVAGEQDVTVAITDKTNYEWEAGGVEDLTFTFTIARAKVTAPTETEDTFTYNGEEQTYTFASAGSSALYTVTNDKRTPAGEQDVTVAITDKTNYEWEAGGDDDLTFTFTIAPKVLTIRTFINEETEVALTYGDAALAANAFTYTVEGILAAEEAEILEELAEVLAISAVDADYEQFAGVGDYVYTTVGGADFPANYEMGTVHTAKITVSAKELTLEAAYEHGMATFSFGGTVNGDVVAVTYSVDGVDLIANEYIAVAADYEKETITATVTPTDPNYAAKSITLKAVRKVTFTVSEPFAAATGVPEAPQYVFDGCTATMPLTIPTIDKYVFRYWAIQDEAYDFSTAVEADLVLTAAWEKTVYGYKFRALNLGADYATGTYRELKWESGAFALADASATFEFTNGDLIPTVGTVGSFRVASWVKAVKVNDAYTYTPVKRFEAAVSAEVDEDAYYVALMTLDLGKGDVNGDGEITAADIIAMKKFLVGVKYQTLANEDAVWQKIGTAAPAGGYLYVFLWDANGDGYKDARDVITERMALVGGYGYEVVSDKNVNGVLYSSQVVVTENDSVFDTDVTMVADLESLIEALDAGEKVAFLADIEVVDEGDYTVYQTSHEIDIDLNGKTLKVGDLRIRSFENVNLRNGVLDMETSLTCTSEHGKIYTYDLKRSDGSHLSDNDGYSVVAVFLPQA